MRESLHSISTHLVVPAQNGVDEVESEGKVGALLGFLHDNKEESSAVDSRERGQSVLLYGP